MQALIDIILPVFGAARRHRALLAGTSASVLLSTVMSVGTVSTLRLRGAT